MHAGIKLNGRSTPELAMQDWEDIIGTPGATRPFYLKHILNSSHEIEESYVEFIVTEDIANANPGMVAGTYSLKGGDSGASYSTNVDIIKAAFGYSTNPSRCIDNGIEFYCWVSGLLAYANSQPNVASAEVIGENNCRCYVLQNVSSCGAS